MSGRHTMPTSSLRVSRASHVCRLWNAAGNRRADGVVHTLHCSGLWLVARRCVNAKFLRSYSSQGEVRAGPRASTRQSLRVACEGTPRAPMSIRGGQPDPLFAAGPPLQPTCCARRRWGLVAIAKHLNGLALGRKRCGLTRAHLRRRNQYRTCVDEAQLRAVDRAKARTQTRSLVSLFRT